MIKSKHRLKITGGKNDTGGGTLRYDFRISPLVSNSGVYVFMRYCLSEDTDKKNEHHNRQVIARDLREKHRKTWERYHMWADEQ